MGTLRPRAESPAPMEGPKRMDAWVEERR